MVSYLVVIAFVLTHCLSLEVLVIHELYVPSLHKRKTPVSFLLFDGCFADLLLQD